MKLKKQQLIIIGVVIVVVVLIAGVFVVLNTGDSGGNNGGDGGDDGSTEGLINTLSGNWIDLSDNINSELGLENVNFNDMHWFGDEGWISSHRGDGECELFHTTDGGETFEALTTPSEFNCIHMLNKLEGYAGSQTYEVYRTIDGGETWTLLFPLTGTPIRDITFPPDSDVGYCCGDIGSVFKITSLGIEKMDTNWVSNMNSICFPTGQEGWVVGESVIRHFTNGAWQSDQGYPGGFTGLSIFMIDNKTGWIVGGNSYRDSDYGGAIIYTTDGIKGKYQENPFATKEDPSWDEPRMATLTDVFFFDENEGWAVGNFGTILHTSDGGTTWTKEADGITDSLMRKIFAINKDLVYFCGNEGTFLKYVGEN